MTAKILSTLTSIPVASRVRSFLESGRFRVDESCFFDELTLAQRG